MSRVVRRLALVAVLATSLLIPASAVAFPLTNCTADLVSLDANGAEIDSVSGGADDATQEDPFLVDYDGTVAWSGTSGSMVFGAFTYGVQVFGIPTPLSGSDTNDDQLTEADGSVGVGENLPIPIVGLFYVTGQVNDTDGNSCEGSGWVQLRGDATSSLPFWLAIILLGLGLVLMVVFRRRLVISLIGGLLAGLGGAMLVVILAVLVAGASTPLIVIAFGIALGLLLWLLIGRRGGGSVPAPSP